MILEKMQKKSTVDVRRSLYRHETVIPDTLPEPRKSRYLPPIARRQSDEYAENNITKIRKTTTVKGHTFPAIKPNNRKMDMWVSPMTSPVSPHKFKGTNTRPSTKDTLEQRTPVVSRQSATGMNPSNSLDSSLQTSSRPTTNLNVSKENFAFFIRPEFDVSRL